MSITTEVRKDLIALVVGVYGAAPGTTLLSSLASTFNTTKNLAAVALSMQSTPAFMSAYPSFLTNGEFATRVVDNILEGRVSAADRTWAIDTLVASLNSGAGRAELILTAVIELQRTTNPAWANAKAAFVNQLDVATHYTVTLQKDGTAAERVAVIANVDQTAASVDAAKAAQAGPSAETVTLTASAASVDEGSSAFFTLQTSAANAGKQYSYSISGVASGDVTGGSLVGSVTIGADGRGLIPVSLTADASTEGTETLTVTVAGQSATITVNDTSLTPAPTPRSMTLTTNQDSGPDFTGNATADTFSALPTTLGTGDVLSGGEGNDTLNLTANLAADVSLAGFSLTSIESINVNIADGANGAANTLTLNMATAGASTVAVSGLSATTLADGLVLNNLAVGSSLAMTNATNVNLTANFLAAATAGTADSVSVTVNGVASTAAADSILTVGNGFETLNIAATGSASVLGDVVSNSTRLNVTGDQNLQVRGGLDASLRTIDASTYTGRLNVVISEPAEATNTNPLFDAADLVVTGGSGNDTINAAAITTQVLEIHINAGVGNDTVTIGQILANASATNAGDIINGGDGTDTLSADVDLVDAAAGFTGTTALTGVTGFETLAINGFADDSIVNVSNISADLRAVQIASAVGAQALTVNFAAGASSVNIGTTAATLAGSTLTVTAAGTATTDALTINNSNLATGTNQIGDNATAIATTGFETVTLNTGSYATATAQLVNTVNVGTNALVLTGSNGLTTTAATGVITAGTIDASALTGVLNMGVAAATGVTTITGGSGADTLRGDASSTINGGAGNDTIVGGTGSDVLNGDDGNDNITTGTSLTATGAAGGSDTVNGGAGNDTIVFGDNLDALDRVNGGDGTDTVSLTNASLTTLKAMTISEANTFNTNFVSVETLQVTDALNQTSFDLGYLNSLTSVRLDAGIDGNETINGFDSGETLDLRATLGATLTVGVNNAAASTEDSFTIRLARSADVDYTDVSIANVETVNIVSTEITASANIRAATLGLTLTQATGGAAQTVNVTGLESLTIDTAIAAGTINASGMTVGLATDAGLTMGVGFTATTAITGQTITGSGKVDALRGSTGADVIDAGAGNDTVHGSRGADSVDGGEGTDTYSTTASQVAANIQGAGTGTSTGVAINLGTTAVTAAAINFALGGNNGLSAASTSLAGGTVQYVFGTQSNFNATTTSTLTNIENITLAGNGNNYVVGSATANVIVGGTGVDHINGGAGNDTITGGAGADVLTGGTGTDTFVFAVGASVASTANTLTGGGIAAGNTVTFGNGVDIITDFAVTTDKLDLTTAAAAPTTLINVATGDALTAGTSYVAYGTWDAAAGAFTIAPEFHATNARDAMLIVDGNGQTAITTTGVLILDNLTAALAAGDII